MPDVKQRTRQPSPGDSPQELGVLAAPAFEPLVHAVALEQISMHEPQAARTGSGSLVAIEFSWDRIGRVPPQHPTRLLVGHSADRVVRQHHLGPRAGQSDRLAQGSVTDERIRVGDHADVVGALRDGAIDQPRLGERTVGAVGF